MTEWMRLVMSMMAKHKCSLTQAMKMVKKSIFEGSTRRGA